MRISTPIAAAGHRAITRIAFPRYTVEECTGKNGKIDRSKGQLAFANDIYSDYRPFRHSKDDDEFVYFVALTLFETLHNAYQDVTSRKDSGVSEGATCKQDELNLKKFDRNKYVFARVDISRKAETVAVRFSVDNPFKAVGEATIEAREFLIACAEISLRMKENIKWLEVETSEIVEEAIRRNAKARLKRINDRRPICLHHRHGYCSPRLSFCPCYKNGKCVNCVEAKV